MAISKFINFKKGKPKPKLGIGSPKKSYALPTKRTVPSDNLNDYSFLCYGRKKIGKTSLFAHKTKTVHFLFEPGAKAQSIYKVPIDGDCFTNWADAIGYVKAIQKNPENFETVVFDTGRPAYDLCLKYYCIKKGIDHPGGQNDYGASWAGVADEFKDVHLRLAGAGVGFCVLAHEKFKEVVGLDHKQYDRVMPNFPGAANDFYEGIIDVICHYRYVGEKRWLKIQGDETTVAGCRIEHRFLTPTGAELYEEIKKLNEFKDRTEFIELNNLLGSERVVNIPMGNNPATSHENLMIAFNNKQENAYKTLEEDQETKKETKTKFKIGKASPNKKKLNLNFKRNK